MERTISPKKCNHTAVHPWDFHEVAVKENFEWVSSSRDDGFSVSKRNYSEWMVKGPIKLSVDDEVEFCDPELLKKLIITKQNVFETYNQNDLLKARIRANPFETIRSAFFMNRAALKMANVDAATDFMFTNIDKDERHKKSEGVYYFADICAGPGGFSEYVLWRKKWAFKGFGFTLKGQHDFKVMESTCCTGTNFQGYYGKANDGDICLPENIQDFKEKIMLETESGVHFTMADGGFSVEGNEHLQEVLSKQIYTCQCLTALEIVRPHGHFMTKLFDTFTLYTVGLLFLMYQCFEKVAIIKPNSSRPANSERYLVCKGLKADQVTRNIRKYLQFVVKELWTMKQNSNNDEDLMSIVPLEVIKKDGSFMQYIVNINNRLGKQQTLNLLKLAMFCENPTRVETRQEDLRNKCLAYWRIPDNPKVVPEKMCPLDLLYRVMNEPEFVYEPAKLIGKEHLLGIDLSKWHYTPLESCREHGSCNIFVATENRKVFGLYGQKWVRVKNLRLIKETILYGEMVVEKGADASEEIDMKSLHVIDALRLGNTSLADIPYEERIPLINTYCEAINYETANLKWIRLRRKPSYKLSNLRENSLELGCNQNGEKVSLLPKINSTKTAYYFNVNSLLFLKTDESESFNTTYISRMQWFLDADESESEVNEEENLSARFTVFTKKAITSQY